jgi:hypothetical protein
MLNTLIKKSFQIELKSHGFNKKGHSWNRSRGEFIDVLTIQEAKYSSSEEMTFTVNIGVFVPNFFNIMWGQEPQGFANEADCVVRLRLSDLIQGRLHGDAQDEWWSLASGSDLNPISKEIVDHLSHKVIPFWESMDNYESISKHTRKVEGWQLKDAQWRMQSALVEWKCGRPTKAAEILGDIKATAWLPRVSKVMKIIGDKDSNRPTS